MEESQETSDEVETGVTIVPANNTRRICPFCGASLTFNSLLAHLDRFVRENDPKTPDGLHDPNEIRRLRGTNARLARKRPFPFLKLPAELRNRIYELHINRGRQNDIVWGGDSMSIRYGGQRFTMRSCLATMLRPTLTCRQVDFEFSSLFYDQNRFYFWPYEVGTLFRFLTSSGLERCRLLRHVAFRRFDDNSPEVAEENLVPIIKQYLECAERSPWNDQKAYRKLLSALWEFRNSGELQPTTQLGGGWYRSVFEADDRLVKYLLLYGSPGLDAKTFQLPPGWERDIDEGSKRCFVHKTLGTVDRVIKGWTLARFANELGDAFYADKDFNKDFDKDTSFINSP